MKIDQVKKLNPQKRFFYWIRERNQILLKRKKGSLRPWTDDEILQSYSFTNVRREEDKVTKWFKKYIRDDLKSSSNVLFATVCFRWFNWPETGEQLLLIPSKTSHGAFTEWKCDLACSRLMTLKEHGTKIFTGAFNISNSGSTKPKVLRVCQDYIQPMWDERDSVYQHMMRCGGNTMSNAFNILARFPGLGGSGFMAAQIVCDLAYTHILRDAPDWWSWCSRGPGSNRGMNRVKGFDEKHNMSKQDWHQELSALRKRIYLRLGLKLHARDVQSCLCEFSKYSRALLNEGHLKRKYNGS